MSTRQTTGFVENLLRLVGLDWTGLAWAGPDFSILCRRQRTLDMRLPYRGGTGPLNLLIDNEASTAIGPRTMPNGIQAEGEGAWNARKPGGSKRRPPLSLGPMAQQWPTFDRQAADIYVRIAVLNRCTALGIAITQPVG